MVGLSRINWVLVGFQYGKADVTGTDMKPNLGLALDTDAGRRDRSECDHRGAERF